MVKKIVIIGAGSTNFGLGVISDFLKSDALRGSEIMLHDINATTLEITHKIAQKYCNELASDFLISATISREEALKGADYCLISIEVGSRFELWEEDWKVPLQFGMKQVFGENGGPGGLFHSLRIIPPILEICGDIQRICADAFVFNFSNPMQRVCHAVSTKFPELKFTGLCHEIKSMERQLPLLLKTNYANIEYQAAGLNHLSILLRANYRDTGQDAYPIIKEKFNKFYSTLVNEHEGFASAPGAERGLFFELFRLHGYLPITTDSHLGEYVNWAHSAVDHAGIIDFYDNYRHRCLSFYQDESSYAHFFSSKTNERKEMVSVIIEHIEGDSGGHVNAVNIKNNGYLDCVPKDIVVEVPAVVDKNGVHGRTIKSYPLAFGGLLNAQAGVIQLTTEAVLQKSKDIAYLALLADPVVENALMARNLLDTMIMSQKKFLGYLQ